MLWTCCVVSVTSYRLNISAGLSIKKSRLFIYEHLTIHMFTKQFWTSLYCFCSSYIGLLCNEWCHKFSYRKLYSLFLFFAGDVGRQTEARHYRSGPKGEKSNILSVSSKHRTSGYAGHAYKTHMISQCCLILSLNQLFIVITTRDITHNAHYTFSQLVKKIIERDKHTHLVSHFMLLYFLFFFWGTFYAITRTGFKINTL